ncbi:MAG: FAD:protein FMN transferase [Lachnospiraceae bacterium]|nr:FAD:protein FMN transferase [Lachnospiraceae bacterium]
MTRRKTSVFFLSLILIISACTDLSGCAQSRKAPYSKQGFYFDTLISITVYDGGDDEILNECFDLCKHYENLFSKTVPGSDISRINEAMGKSVSVSEETIDLIEKAVGYYELSDGLYDITIKPLVDAWGFEALNDKDAKPLLPSKEQTDTALSHVSSDNILIDRSAGTVTLKDPLASMDTGSIAKGYIADRLRDFLISRGVGSALIDLGGNITVINGKAVSGDKTAPGNKTVQENKDQTDFIIGIRDPFDPGKREPAISLSVRDTSVVTSGIYERYLTIDGIKYHHILDKNTGFPVDNSLESVTVITHDAADADALSTVCLLLGEEKGLSLINGIEDCEAVFIKKDGTFAYSEGAMDLLKR